jgi:tetratricopeptide (TPR) repeat protein
MGSLIFIVLSIIGISVGIWAFSVFILPFVYGLPKAIYYIFKGLLKPSSSFIFLIAPAIWVSILILVGKFFPSISNYLLNSSGFLTGLFLGCIFSSFYAFTKSGRNTLKSDFWSNNIKRINTSALKDPGYWCSKLMTDAMDLLSENEYREAIMIFEKIIEIDNNYLNAYTLAATLYQRIGDNARAIKLLENAPRDMNRAYTLVQIDQMLGALYGMTGNIGKAVKSAEQALELLKEPIIRQQISKQYSLEGNFNSEQLEQEIKALITELKTS